MTGARKVSSGSPSTASTASDDRFWETYDWFQKRFMEDEPVKGGLLDLNRYYYHAE